MKRMFQLVLCLLPLTAVAADGFNARWIAKEGAPVGFWIHDNVGTCETLKDATIAIGTKDAKAGSAVTAKAESLSFCLLFTGADKSSNCSGGTVQAAYDPARKAYAGKYQLTFKNGEKRSGEFTAQYCEQKPAAKKG